MGGREGTFSVAPVDPPLSTKLFDSDSLISHIDPGSFKRCSEYWFMKGINYFPAALAQSTWKETRYFRKSEIIGSAGRLITTSFSRRGSDVTALTSPLWRHRFWRNSRIRGNDMRVWRMKWFQSGVGWGEMGVWVGGVMLMDILLSFRQNCGCEIVPDNDENSLKI